MIFGIMLFCLTYRIEAQDENLWTLEECIDYALERNIQVRKSELANERYELYAGQAKSQRFPSVSASASQNFGWTRNTGEGESGFTGSSGSNYMLNSGITIYNGSKLTNQIKQAGLDIESGQYSLETTKESISLSILDAYLQVLYAEEQVKNTERQIESTTSQVNLATERLAIQLISQADYAQVKSELASEKFTLASAESQLALAKVNLMQLMELPVSDDFNLIQPETGESVNQNRIPDVSEVYETALGIKPQVKNAAVNKEIASLDEKIAKAGYYPSISASAGVSTGYSFIDDLTIENDPYFEQLDKSIHPSVGITLSIPIFQRNQVKTSVEAARIGYKDAELSEIDTRNQLRKNIEQACQDVISAQAEYESSAEKYEAILESSLLSDEKFRQGLINSVDYQVSRTNLITAESQLLQSKYNLIFSYKVIDFYMGIPLSL